MVHRAKVDWWGTGLIGGGAFLLVAAGAAVLVVGFATGDPGPQDVVILGSVFVGGGVLMGLLLRACYNIRYEITSSDLVVRFGPFGWTLRLETIVEVFPTHNPLAAPAPSLDRLRVNYRRKNGKLWFALVSPKDKEGFVRDLASAAPQLRSAGSGPLRLRAEEPA